MSQNHISERHGSGNVPEVTLHGTGLNYGTKATYRSHGSDAREAHALETGSRSNSLRPPSAGSKQPRQWTMPARWKLLGIALALIMVHTISANMIIPLVTGRIMGLSSTSNTISDFNDPMTQSLATSRSLTETLLGDTDDEADDDRPWENFVSEADGILSGAGADPNVNLTLLYGPDGRGKPIFTHRDALTNPFLLPPLSVAEALNASNVKPFDPHKLRPINYLYRERCRNDVIVPLDGRSGMEWAMTCKEYLNKFGRQVSKYRWCRGGNEIEVPDLRRLAHFRSNRTRNPNTVTIVTQLSVERLGMLEQQCSFWPNTIAAVVYIPLVKGKISSNEADYWNNQPVEFGLTEMTKFYERMATEMACVLDLEVVVEERCNKDAASLYPANAVRNRAIMLTETEIVLLLDVDFVASLSLAYVGNTTESYAELLNQLENHNAIVLPAFEAWDQGDVGKKIALEAVHRGKEFISMKFMYNVVIGFHMSHYPQGHEKTNFWKWINTTEPYAVEYQTGFEPYILMSRKLVPFYDERFRGYYWNKVQHLMHISTQNNFTFVVYPDAFVVHVPHKKPAMKWKTRSTGQKERNHVMFLEALKEMGMGRWAPVTSFPHLCMPPILAEAAADVVPNEIQKDGLLKAADDAEYTDKEMALLDEKTRNDYIQAFKAYEAYMEDDDDDEDDDNAKVIEEQDEEKLVAAAKLESTDLDDNLDQGRAGDEFEEEVVDYGDYDYDKEPLNPDQVEDDDYEEEDAVVASQVVTVGLQRGSSTGAAVSTTLRNSNRMASPDERQQVIVRPKQVVGLDANTAAAAVHAANRQQNNNNGGGRLNNQERIIRTDELPTESSRLAQVRSQVAQQQQAKARAATEQ